MIIIAVVIGVVLIAGGGFYLVNQKLSEEEYSEQMKKAEKYLNEQDYDNAILAYEAAIKADKSADEPYLELANIYVLRGESGKAEYYLSLGMKNASNTGKLEYMLNKVLVLKEQPKTQDTEEESTEEEEEMEEMEAHRVSGTVVNAVTGEGVADITVNAVRIDDEEAEVTGEVKTSDRTKANGQYELYLVSGEYSITINQEGFVEETFTLSVGDKEIRSENLTISPKLAEGEIRIVLEWGAHPSDLDAYLFADSVNSSPIFFGSKGSKSRGAMLDVDETRGYGPETITIYDMSKTWIYGVQDFTMSSTGLTASGATVKVYLPEQEPIVYTAPSGTGNYWRVCKIVNGEVTAINTINESGF